MNAIRQIMTRYESWESRRAHRLSSWPRRRRWLVFLLLPTGTPSGVGVHGKLFDQLGGPGHDE
jgi:hypothetical protein